MAAKYAELTNVMNFNNLMLHVMNADASLPSIVCFYGKSGVGKTTAAVWAANYHRAKYIEVGASWSKKTLIENLAKQFSIPKIKSIPDGVQQIITSLLAENRPIIIDEADYLIDGAKIPKIELIREISDATNCPIVLLGEGNLPTNMQSLERMDNRILKWQMAVTASDADTDVLVKTYAPDYVFAPALVRKLNSRNKGIVRRIMSDIYRVCDVCSRQDITEIDVALFEQHGGQFNPLHTPNGGSANT